VAVFHDIGIFPGASRYYDELLESGAVTEIFSAGTLRAVVRMKES